MTKIGPFNVAYDQHADILYLNVGHGIAARGSEDENGIVWRYSQDGAVIGMTLMDFRDFWLARKSALVDEISRGFHVSFREASAAIDNAARNVA